MAPAATAIPLRKCRRPQSRSDIRAGLHIGWTVPYPYERKVVLLMADTTNCTHCVACDCPALPRVTFDQAVIDLMESIALQESALSHILCAETQKMKAALSMEELDLCKLLEVNDSATNMVHAVANLELVLKEKLEFIANNLYYPSTENNTCTTTES